ncbi:Dyp-type peroxidase [Nocardioides nitrophenolicus]|uniref:Dyp-type peroxidase n=1 Tax=Nocardioides nitrophenolicus TaxID=60489 RepID=UPI001958553E|nr:Dyp-type peroxidase [Nocardioides nitrophenolicus]MBM7516971.1 dye decolorizing peroxidase [Nocardioides nitrophenolicus]
MSRTTRRGLVGLGVASAVGLAACRAGEDPAAPGPEAAAGPPAVDPNGAQQAGIVRPALPQAQLVSLVLDVVDGAGGPGPLLRDLGALVVELTDAGVQGVAPGDLTVTVGVGPRLVAAVDPGLPGASELPEFGREEIAEHGRGGDLWVQVCATDPLVVSMAVSSVRALLEDRTTLRWSQRAWRGAAEDTSDKGVRAARNVQGFQDGIIAPRGSDELDASVWLAGPEPVVGGTIAVVRRFRIDVDAWRALSTGEQEAAVGRERASSVPLSGKGDPNLTAKTPDGRYLIPADSHVRRAHPLDVGVPMMLRRSYSIDEPSPGLLFISFQNTLRAFTATMQRLDESDRMMEFATTTATGTFLVLPGHSATRPLGSTLFR